MGSGLNGQLVGLRIISADLRYNWGDKECEARISEGMACLYLRSIRVTIKETAGKVLLYFYQLQRTAPLAMPYRQLGFIDKKDKGVGLTSDKKWFAKDLLGINAASSDIFNAFSFLRSKGYIKSNERVGASAIIYVGIQLTGAGIDIIEGIERDSDGRREFELAFNIGVESSEGVEGLIRGCLGSLTD